jgi:hypothetical protein
MTVGTVIGATVIVITTYVVVPVAVVIATITVITAVGATVIVITTCVVATIAVVVATITIVTAVGATVTVMTTRVVANVAGWFSKSRIDSTQTECATHYASQNGFQSLPPRCVGRKCFG